MTGIFLDVAGRNHAEDSHKLLADDMTMQLTNRLPALGRADNLIRPLPND